MILENKCLKRNGIIWNLSMQFQEPDKPKNTVKQKKSKDQY